MSLDIPIGEDGPMAGGLPCIVPRRLGKLRARPVDHFHRGGIADAEMIGADLHDRTMFLMQADIFMLKTATAEVLEVPQVADAGPKRSWDRS